MNKRGMQNKLLFNRYGVKRGISILLVLTMMMAFTACGKGTDSTAKDTSVTEPASNNSENASETTKDDPILTGAKPKLKILSVYQAYDYNEQPSKELIEEITGYEVEFFALPQERAQEKLMLEISSGADYDILMRMAPADYSALSNQNALLDLNDLLDQYGSNIKSAIGDLAWRSVSDENGVINGIPHENASATIENPYGAITGGIGIRSDMLAELGLEVPTTLDEFTALLKAAKDKYNIAPMTDSKTVFNNAILSSFGLGSSEWADVNGVYTPRVKNPKLVEYLAYMQKLYQEKLLDNDTPINSMDNAKEKFATKNALAVPLYFWDLPSLNTALKADNPDVEVKFITSLAPDSETKPVWFINKANEFVTCISKNTKNAAHAINFLNILSDPTNFKRVYVGEEGKSFKVENDQYIPIFEGDGNFSNYTNSDKFTGFSVPSEKFAMWQARARKTPEMAVAYEEMNSRTNEMDFMYTIEGYGKNSPLVQQYMGPLNQAFYDSTIKAVVEGTNPTEAIAKMQEDWDRNGGLEVEKAMQEFYDTNKSYME